MKRLVKICFALVAAIGCLSVLAQIGDPATLIKEKLASEIKTTKITADRTDIVTAGDVVLLHKDGLMMCSSDSSYPYSNSYNNGVLAGNIKNRAKDTATSVFKAHLPFGGGGSITDAANNGCNSRKFVAGEKFFVSDIKLVKDGILISTYSDPYNDVRYYGEIKFPFPKGSVPPVDAFVKTVSQVITVEPQSNTDTASKGDSSPEQSQPAAPSAAQAAQQASATAPAPMPDIAPPPPPADAPPAAIAIGETKDQVSAAFGQPQKDAKVGQKEICVYQGKKVTFTNGKVSNVE